MVNPIIALGRPEKEDLKPSEYIDHACHNTAGISTLWKYIINISWFDSVMREEWIIFMDLVQKALVGEKVTTGPTDFLI